MHFQEFSKMDELIMSAKFSESVSILRFHPFEPQLAIVEGNVVKSVLSLFTLINWINGLNIMN